MSRKSPAPKPAKSSKTPAAKQPTLAEPRAIYLLEYISRVNRHTLLALHQLGQAPDCQVSNIPALIHFGYTFEKHGFHVRGSLTQSQATVLTKAAQASIDTFLEKALQIAKTLSAAVTAAAEGLVGAVEGGGDTKLALQVAAGGGQPLQPSGCCYYTDRDPEPNIPYSLCVAAPDFLKWDGGMGCLEDPRL